MLGSWKAALGLVGGLFLLAGARTAQCPVPDHFDGGPCCTVASPIIPSVPKFQQDALEICWRDCNVDQVISYRSVWKNLNIANPTTGVPCGERTMTLELFTVPGGALAWSGNLRLQYSRTWLETDPSGFPLQVWRFLINGDMRPVLGTAAIPCPIPSCAPAHGNRVRFTGYIDSALNCAIVPGFYQRAWMLSHVCDFIDHHPGFPRAGTFHPDRSYSFVGPAAGFVPAPLQPIEGTPGSPFEAMRQRRLPIPGTTGTTCEFEERLLQFNLAPQQQFCLCGLPPTQQWMLGNLTVAGACGSSVTTPGGPFLPGFLSMGIGSWTLPGVFPGVERVRWNSGGYDHVDGCIGAVQQQVYYGATTIGGFPAFQLLSTGPAGPLPLTFIDQSNSLSGGLTVMNVPYVSDHFLNLNH